MHRKNIPTTYTEAREALKGRRSRAIANNTTLVDQGEGVIGLRLHSTVVVVFNDSGHIILSTGGYRTVTTKDRLNRVVRAHGWSIFCKAREWFVSHRTGATFEFEDGFTIPPAPRKPAREDHCTHPEQDFCDCDWCRVLRTSPDARVENHGTIFLVRALTESALAWLEAHTDGQWLGNGLAVEPRYVGALVEGLREHGFTVEAA